MGTTPALTKAVEEKFSFGTEGKADFVNDNENEKPVVLEKVVFKEITFLLLILVWVL